MPSFTSTARAILLLVASLPSIASAWQSQKAVTNSVCQNTVRERYVTPLGPLELQDDELGGSDRYFCLDGTMLANSRRNGPSDYYSFRPPMLGYGIHAFDGESGGLKRVRRLVVQENTSIDCDNKYWLLDFRGKEPLVVGPFGDHDCSERFYVIWGDETVAIAIYVDKDEELSNTPRRLELDDQGEEAYERDERTGKMLPLYNTSGSLDSESSVTHEGYIYSYKTRKVTKAIIED